MIGTANSVAGLLPCVEIFRSVQGEGVYSGTPMLFVRTQGCSVGKRVCTRCDTDFETLRAWHGGGTFTPLSIRKLAQQQQLQHICLTGGEPLDYAPLCRELEQLCFVQNIRLHLETSGTVIWTPAPETWLTVSPKPGWKQDMIDRADEIKVIVGGLGGAVGWPTLEDALSWAASKKVVFLQPCNDRYAVNMQAVQLALELVYKYPQLRLGTQLHKLLSVR
jgi:7-carboxy-7-deazaguanine synthase